MLASLILCGSLTGPATAQTRRDADLFSEPVDLELGWMFEAGPVPQEPGTRQRSFSLTAFSQLFEFDLVQSSPFLPGAATVWIAADGRRLSQVSEWGYWEGRLRENPDSAVRLRTKGSAVEGLIRDGDQVYLLQPVAGRPSRSGGREVAILRLGEWETPWSEHGCGVQHGDWAGDPFPAAALEDVTSTSRAKGAGLREVELRLLVDSFYFQRYGLASADRVQGLVHQLNGVFEEELGLTLRITETVVSTSPSQDVVGSSLDGRRLLDELGEAGLLAGADMAHLFTGRELEGELVGISWMGAACDPRHGVSLSQEMNGAPARFMLLAHELAHVLGARHDGRDYCNGFGHGWIMWPVIDGSGASFSTCSRELVSLFLRQFSCVSPIAPEQLPAPVTEPVGATKPIRLRWSRVEGAESYQVEVFDEDAGGTVYSETVSETEVLPDAEFREGRRYRWRVVGLNPSGMGRRSPWQPFSVSRWAVR